jgi:hypothetical protein
MRLISLLFTATLVASPAWAGSQAASSPKDQQTPTKDQQTQTTDQQPPTSDFDLPVSLDRIKQGLEQAPTTSLRLTDARPTFRVQILERQRIEELLATLNFKTTRAPAGGLYWDEVQRQMWPSVDNPLRQPYAAFNQGELLTVVVENLVREYLSSKVGNAITGAVRSRAESSAREEVRQAIRDYCAAQPNNGAGIQICSTSSAAPVR